MPRVFSQEDGGLDNAAIVTSRKKVYKDVDLTFAVRTMGCLLYTSPSPRDRQKSRMPSSA